MKLRPTAGKALIKAEIPDDVSEGGIALPVDRVGDPKDNPNIGIVLDVGAPLDGTAIPEIKKGDRVVFTDFWMTKTGIKDVYVVEQVDIVAVLENEGEPFTKVADEAMVAAAQQLRGKGDLINV